MPGSDTAPRVAVNAFADGAFAATEPLASAPRPRAGNQRQLRAVRSPSRGRGVSMRNLVRTLIASLSSGGERCERHAGELQRRRGWHHRTPDHGGDRSRSGAARGTDRSAAAAGAARTWKPLAPCRTKRRPPAAGRDRQGGDLLSPGDDVRARNRAARASRTGAACRCLSCAPRCLSSPQRASPPGGAISAAAGGAGPRSTRSAGWRARAAGTAAGASRRAQPAGLVAAARAAVFPPTSRQNPRGAAVTLAL